MTVNTTLFTDWARKPASTLAQFNRTAPAIAAINTDADTRFPGTLNVGTYKVRNARGTGTPSVHSWGAAGDRSYRGAGRQVALSMIDFYVAHSAELHIQAVHDYIGGTIWRSVRSRWQGGGGWKQQRPNASSGMGQPWADWLHLEVTEQGWSDGRPVAVKLGGETVTTNRPRITVGSRGPVVAAAQIIMRDRASQDVGAIDGVFGARTLAAWQNVAAWCQWPVDSAIDGDDWNLLAWIDQGWDRLNAAGVR